jgi:hypothetical protein
MNVQELIDELQKIQDKTLLVVVESGGDLCSPSSIEECSGLSIGESYFYSIDKKTGSPTIFNKEKIAIQIL